MKAHVVTRGFLLGGMVLAWAAHDGRSQDVGVVQGIVVVDSERTRKTASRYPAGGRSVRGAQVVPPVVFLDGDGLAAQPAPRTVEIAQSDTAFAPSAVAIRTRTVVRFPNGDPFFHNVFSYAGNARFDLGRYPEGESREYTFDEAGIARVFCEVHEFMRAVVVVTDHPYASVLGDDGSFRFDDVPAGEYTLVAYQPDVGRVEEPVVLSGGGTVRLRVELR